MNPSAVIAKLHAPRSKPLPDLIPLSQWFSELKLAAKSHGGILSLSAATAHELLTNPREVGVLHGDIHHDNVLDFGERGWLAIDPKRLIGERSFDYANLFCNPDHKAATSCGRFTRQVAVVTEAAGLERKRLLQWILAWADLSAAWFLGDSAMLKAALTMAHLAAAELAYS